VFPRFISFRVRGVVSFICKETFQLLVIFIVNKDPFSMFNSMFDTMTTIGVSLYFGCILLLSPC
jgi:hypothetical protein